MNTSLEKLETTALNGLIAGCIATIPMTLALLVLKKIIPGEQDRKLPPERITENVAEKLLPGSPVKNAPAPVAKSAFMLAHLGFGAGSGTVCSILGSQWPGSHILKGSLYGLGVWTANYAGMLPMLEIYPHAKDQPKTRSSLMILGHLVWGISTSMLISKLDPLPRLIQIESKVLEKMRLSLAKSALIPATV